MRVTIHQLQVAGQLLDPVDLAASFDLDGHVHPVGVAGQDVDRPDRRHVFAANQRVAIAQRGDVFGEQRLQVGLDAVLDQAGIDPELMARVGDHLVDPHAQLIVALAVLDHPDRGDA